MARRGKRGRSGGIVSILVFLFVGFCVVTSWQDKNGTSLGLPEIDAPTGLFSGILDRFEELGEDHGEPVQAVTGTMADAGLEVHFIDVGQAEAILIKAPGANVLIDAGENDQGDLVVRYLKNAGARQLDYAVGTHPHSDHIGGLDVVIAELSVGNIILPDIPDEIVPTTQTYTDLLLAIAKKGLKVTPAKPGKTYDLGDGAQLQLLAPLAEYSDLNNMSVVCRLTYGETSFLFTGDACTGAESDLLSSGYTLRSTVLSVGHHGSNTSSGEAFLAAVAPRIAVISVGVDNSYGHPHREIVERLEAIDARILRTDHSGAVVIQSDGQRLSVTTEK